jgi:glycosyltransferase involved in cell wall biosynthesis
MAGPRKNRVIAHPAGDRFNPEISREMIESRANKEGPLRILFLGNVIPRKGLHILLEALGKIDENDWKLSVVGSMNIDARYGRMIKQIAKDNRLDNHIEFFGSLGEEELKRILSASHILAVPSYLEGYGIAYLEGMGFGLPAIGTASGGASEIITHDVNGYLVPRGNVSFLAECISRLIDDRELLIAMSLRARETYLLHPTWESSMKHIRGFLEENTNPERVR